MSVEDPRILIISSIHYLVIGKREKILSLRPGEFNMG
jgi:hypothetical protein